ncbi:MAG: chemotaxis protein CheA [Gemmatimonadota bacterium]|nr:chemotaxis protein CheA [Gemmatimonadota bacterium]
MTVPHLDLARYAELFLSESREHLAAMNRSLLELERAPSAKEPVAALFRAAHTIKGMSASMGYTEVAEITHGLESVLERVRSGALQANGDLVDALFGAADVLEAAVERSVEGRSGEVESAPIIARLTALAGGAPAAAPESAPASSVPRADGRSTARREVRIDSRRLDSLMNLVGELVIARDRVVELSRGRVDTALEESMEQTGRLITQLQAEMLQSRMVPVSRVFDRFPRLVRDAARSAGKEVVLEVEGGEIELDRAMLDEIGEPIVHLLRNAVDHGVETPVVRAASGKLPVGRLRLTAVREKSAVTIRVSDDGRGIDRERVLATARARGLVEDTAQELSDDELLRVIAHPGFSTADVVTELSGRGVGVDVVQSRVRALGGTVHMQSASGRGTTVTLRLPPTLAIVRALLARVDGETYLLPMSHVSETVQLDPAAVKRVTGREVIMLRDEVLPLLRLREAVVLPSAVREGGKVLVIENGGRRAGLVVDDLVGQQDVVVKQFDAVRGGVPFFSGVTILGDGAPALIVDVVSLLAERP